MQRAACILGLLVSLTARLVASPWPEVHSDLPPDPALRQGTLANGLRFQVLPNAEPKNRISLRLLVAAGSLHENSDERGLAHFIEHMAFRGTREYPAGSVTLALQRLGLGLGPDSAAFTTYDHTIYHLELPDANEATLREGLRVFREFAGNVTFDTKLIDKERGVVLSEMATRDTPPARSSLANLEFLFPTSRETRRAVIGAGVAIRTFRRDQFVSFYDAWYRPERMAVVAVGDFDPAMVERLINEELSGLTPRGPPRDDPPDLKIATASSSNVAIFADPGMLGVGIFLEHPFAQLHGEDTHERRVELLHQSLAFIEPRIIG